MIKSCFNYVPYGLVHDKILVSVAYLSEKKSDIIEATDYRVSLREGMQCTYRRRQFVLALL